MNVAQTGLVFEFFEVRMNNVLKCKAFIYSVGLIFFLVFTLFLQGSYLENYVISAPQSSS